MSDKTLKVNGGDIAGAVSGLLKSMLESGKLAAVLVNRDTSSKRVAFPVLVSDPAKLKADVFAPVLPVATATVVSDITRMKGPEKAIGLVMPSCQIRALVELVKLHQANLDNVLVIGVDCLGTFDTNLYAELKAKQDPTAMVIGHYKNQNPDIEAMLRPSCRACKDPVPVNADITIGVFGMDIQNELLVQANTEKGEKLLEGLDLGAFKGAEARDSAVKAVRSAKDRARAEFVKRSEGIKGVEALAKFYDKCVNCHNCMHVCPVCYCRECLFESAVFDLGADSFVRKAGSRGLLKMPRDSLLFHVTRMNHMIVSCVECGLCEQACPNDIPLMQVIIPVAEAAQKEFGYTPGKDKGEAMPMVVFKEDEFHDAGESKDGCC